MLDRVLVVYPIHLGGLEHHIGVDLSGAQGRRGVGGEKRIAGAGGEDHHPPLLHVANGLAADVGLRHLLHRDGALHPGGHPSPLQAILERDRVHHGGQHADVVGRGPIHAGGTALETAKNVATTNHDGHFGVALHHLGHIGGN